MQLITSCRCSRFGQISLLETLFSTGCDPTIQTIKGIDLNYIYVHIIYSIHQLSAITDSEQSALTLKKRN